MGTHEDWIARRDAAVFGAYGIATLDGTFWLDGTPRTFDGGPGVWHTDGVAVIGDLDGTAVRLSPGEATSIGARQLRAFARESALALRVLDPEAPARNGLSGIERFRYDPALTVRGRFVPRAATAASLAVDGHHAETLYAGHVALTVHGAALELTVTQNDDGSLSAALSDATSGATTYRFRFLHLPPPDADDSVIVDLNRLYLPPCAFSDHYVCVFPPAGNRWTVPLEVGEARTR